MMLKKYTSLPIQVKASLWYLICSFLQRGISVITTPVFTRIMSASEYGRYVVFNSWYDILFIIITLSLIGGVHTQGLIKFANERKVYTSSLQGLTATLVFVWFAFYIILHSLWNRLTSFTTLQMTVMFGIIWMTAVFGFWANVQRVEYKFRDLAAVTLISAIFRPILEIVLVLRTEDKATARIIGWAIVDFVVFGWMFFYQLRQGKVFFSERFWSYAVHFNLPLVPHYLSQTVLNSADRIMIERMVGEDKAGIYGLAYSLAMVMTLFSTAISQTIDPWLYQRIKDRKEKQIASTAYLSLIVIGSVNLTLILFAPEAVAVFAPKPYHEAIWIVPPVAMSVFFMYSYDLFAKFAFYYERTKAIMLASITGALLNIMLNYVFIHRFGYIAAGYTTLCCYIIYAVMHYILMRKVCKEECNGVYPYETRVILTIAFWFLVLGFALLSVYRFPAVRYGIAGISMIVCICMRRRIAFVIQKLIVLKTGEKPSEDGQ